MRRRVPFAIAVFFIAAAIARAEGVATNEPAAPAHLVWALRLVSELRPGRNAYGWDPTYVVWDEDGSGPARNRSVCSSFVSHDLERAYGLHRSTLRERFGTANPQAKDYYEAIVAGRGFERIARLPDLRPGDVIAIRYPAGSHPTGHVMIVAGAVLARVSTAPIVDGTAQFELPVIDSSESFHGFDDTRYLGGERHADGVGAGTVRLYANADGSIAGYAWSTRRVSKFYGSNERELAIGRFETAYAGPPAASVASSDADDGDDGDDGAQP